MSEDTIILFIS